MPTKSLPLPCWGVVSSFEQAAMVETAAPQTAGASHQTKRIAGVYPAQGKGSKRKASCPLEGTHTNTSPAPGVTAQWASAVVSTEPRSVGTPLASMVKTSIADLAGAGTYRRTRRES